MMKPESLVELVTSGNSETVEAEWMDVMQASETAPDTLGEYHVVLRALLKQGKESQAEELAWSAIEALSARLSPTDTLKVAGPLLLAVGDATELRAQVVELYRTGFGDRDGFEALLSESGLGGGRPVRRAIRTLDLCLGLEEGAYLAERDADGAARVEKIDTGTWKITVADENGAETLGAVLLADQYRAASATEFVVMRQFAPDELSARLKNDSAGIVIEICQGNGGTIDTETLERKLVPSVIDDADWKKWWTKARTALKRTANVSIKGRNPGVITYVDRPALLEEDMYAEFGRQREPQKQLAVVDQYVRDCKARGEAPSSPALERCFEKFAEQARRMARSGALVAGLHWAMAIKVRRAAGHDDIPEDAISLLSGNADLKGVFDLIDDESLLDCACDWLQAARPDDWADQLLALLPTFPLSACERTTRRLAKAGRGAEDFKRVVQEILASPAENFEGLLWLWDGPSTPELIAAPPLTTLLSRILRTLDDCRRTEKLGKERTKKIAVRARAVFAARKYQRFDLCLEELDAEMASPLCTQLRKLELLGRAVRDDMVRRLERRFPPVATGTRLQPWEYDDVLYVTEAGLVRKQAEIEHLVNVKMKENAVAIGAAAERGDLSENSEYKFALEERDLLRARLAQMNAEMAMSRVMTAADVPTDHIGIGSRAGFKRVSDGEPYVMTIVGPWEADGEARVFNYRAPLCQRVLGLRVGDTIEFDHTGANGKYEVVSVENALLEDAHAHAD